MMRIVDVNPYFYPFFGGIEHRMHLIAKELVARGHDVTIVTGQLPGTAAEEVSEDGYRIVRLPSKYIKFYNPPYITSKGLLEKLNEIDADVVNFNYRWAPSYTKDMRKYQGKKVFTYHNMWGEGIGIQHTLSEINDNMFRKTLNTFDHIIAVSDYVRNDLIRRGIPSEEITTANPCLENYPELSENEGDYILSLGRLVRTKGLDYLIEAMQYVDSKLIVCGKGPDDKRLRKKIEKYGLSEKIEMKGWVSEEEKQRLMSECRMFVMPSLFESYGLAALEIMSYGRPVVCTDVNGLPDTVKDGGIYVKPKDAKGLANAINSLLLDKDGRETLGSNARRVAESQNVKNTVDIIESVYRSVIDGNNRSQHIGNKSIDEQSL